MKAMFDIIKKQKGLTPVSTVLIVVIVALFVLIILKLFPVYKDQWVIRSILTGVKKDSSFANKSRREIKDIIMRRASINQVTRFTEKEIFIEKTGGATNITIQVDVIQPLVGNLSLHVAINEVAQVR